MNQHDYYIFSQISFFIGVLFLLIGSFLLEVYDVLDYRNLYLMIFIFICFFGISIYFNHKREKIESEMIHEIKKYIKEVNNGTESKEV